MQGTWYQPIRQHDEPVYNQNRYDREKQGALESWERKFQAIITGKGKDNVVSIGTAKGIKAA